MPPKNTRRKVSESPTNPKAEKRPKVFDVADLYKGPVAAEETAAEDVGPLDEKLRQAYFWVANHAIISPFYDIEYDDGPGQRFTFGEGGPHPGHPQLRQGTGRQPLVPQAPGPSDRPGPIRNQLPAHHAGGVRRPHGQPGHGPGTGGSSPGDGGGTLPAQGGEDVRQVHQNLPHPNLDGGRHGSAALLCPPAGELPSADGAGRPAGPNGWIKLAVLHPSRICLRQPSAMTISGHDIAGVYKPRNPKDSAFYNCVETHFEELERFWDDLYASRYGFWRPYIKDVIYRYLDCGDLRCGFARVRCDHCGHEYLLAFSCKRRHFCPSCHQKRVVEYGEWLLTDVLKKVPHRHWVFSIPKRLRIYFMYDRSLLGKLSKCAWKVTRAFLKSAVPREEAVPGASIAIQTYGDFLPF